MLTEWSQASELCEACQLLTLSHRFFRKSKKVRVHLDAAELPSSHILQCTSVTAPGGFCVRGCLLNIQLITLTTGLLMGKWRAYTYKQTVSRFLCMWNEIGHQADGLTVCWLWGALPADSRGRVSLVTEARWTQPQLFTALPSCILHVSLSSQTVQGVAVCGFTVQLHLPACDAVPTISWLTHSE